VKRSLDRILVTHAGSLPRPADLDELVAARSSGEPYDAAALARRLREAVAEVVRRQVASGIDIVNDGELSKPSFLTYARERLAGIALREFPPGETPPVLTISGRDRREFPDYFATRGGRAAVGTHPRRTYCVAPLRYIGHEAVQTDIANLRAALQGVEVTEAFLTAVAPGTIEHWLANAYYPTDEAYLYAIADAMHAEYRAIVDAGFVLQIDDPDLPDAWQIHADLSVEEYRRFAELRIDALNHALRDLPEDRVRLHICWGSYHGPHKHDIPLRAIVDLVLKVRAGAYSIEAANPRHEHEWQVWDEVKLPDGKILIPGVVSHCSDFIEHPELVAQRLLRFARLVGRENVIAGTDCGLGGRVGHPSIVWAKFEAMAEGARLATRQLWGGAA
jgi:5-methyltetrahydropteroyltriglutamate--homocysteine methyltransferase